jgi:hypothetical protein
MSDTGAVSETCATTKLSRAELVALAEYLAYGGRDAYLRLTCQMTVAAPPRSIIRDTPR